MQLIALTRMGTVGQEAREPLLTDRIVVVPANASMAEPTLAALDRTGSDGNPAVEIAAERVLLRRSGEMGLPVTRPGHRTGFGHARQRPRGHRPRRCQDDRRLGSLPGHADRAGRHPPPPVVDSRNVEEVPARALSGSRARPRPASWPAPAARCRWLHRRRDPGGEPPQRERWGSPAWVESFSRRSRVEGTFGLLKNSKTGNVKRGWTPVTSPTPLP